MSRIQLVHWNQTEAREKIALLRRAGYDVGYESRAQSLLRALKADPPDAMVIDLSRLPGHGRDVAITVRHNKAIKLTPIVFVGGDPDKVKLIKELLPDAVYTTWRNAAAAIEQTISDPPEVTVIPRSVLEGYAGTPLPKKLGIKTNSKVVLISAPADFEKILGVLPEGAKLVAEKRADNDLIIWFNRSRRSFEMDIDRIIPLVGQGGIWIVWPKQSSKLGSDLTQLNIRETCFASGLVDYKICAINDTWSGMRFARRKR